MKRCTKCGAILPDDSFSKRTDSLDGLQGWCKHCFSQFVKRPAPSLLGPRSADTSVDKACSSCGDTKPVSDFYFKHADAPWEGRQSRCKACCCAAKRKLGKAYLATAEFDAAFDRQRVEQTKQDRREIEKKNLTNQPPSTTLPDNEN